MNELSKIFEPKEIEAFWAAHWASNPFKADPASGKPPFTIVIPPPNVTGNLHLGHALDNTIIDTIVRFKRMQGFEALYLPGTDHAGITTQVLVERELAAEGTNRHELGREGFLERVWAFKERNGGLILEQLRRIGVSCDWSRERFTMDEGLARAVRRAFVGYYDHGLAYRGERIVHWDPQAQTVLSDLEVDREERPGKMYTLAYRFEDDSGEILVATVRPETIFADVAVAVHPNDERYKGFIGRRVRIPLTDRFIPVIADEAVEDFGTGALKVTPAHDPVDFEIGERHRLEKPSIIGKDARLFGPLVPEAFLGLERFEARDVVARALEDAGLLRETKDHTLSLGISERTKVPVEPLLLTQWFVRVEPLAKQVLSWLDEGRIKLVPERWEKVNRDWLENIRDWAVGRQLWWGHQIPAWYDKNGKIYVPSPENPDLDCDKDPRFDHLELTRDPDVFDTWFSSALWPFSTLGWPEQTDDLERFYPSSVLVTGYDILFFWVARMQMAAAAFMGEVPFHAVLLHGLYLDAAGQKMSKSKGNGIDPLELLDQFGADACRFAWAYLATGGQDIRHDERRYEMGRNFANKLWNASRFVLAQFPSGYVPSEHSQFAADHLPTSGLTLADRWILAKLRRAVLQATEELEAFDLAASVRTLYAFTWDEFCDWYLEAAKPALRSSTVDAETADEAFVPTSTHQVLVYVLGAIVKLLHPFMPFITSEIHKVLFPEGLELAFTAWPQAGTIPDDPDALRRFEFLRSGVSLVRSLRSELGLSPAQQMSVTLSGEGREAILAELETFGRLARVQVIEQVGKSLGAVAPGLEVRVPLEGTVDVRAFRTRSEKRRLEFEKQIKTAQGKLANEGFVARAPTEVIEEERRRLEDFTNQLKRLETVLAELD